MSERLSIKRISKWPNKWKDIWPHQSWGKCILKAQWETTPLPDIGGFCSTRNLQTLLDENVNCYNTLGNSFEWVEGTHTYLPSSSFFDYTCSSEDRYKKVYGILVHDGSKLECPSTVSGHNKFLLSSIQQKRNAQSHLPAQMCFISNSRNKRNIARMYTYSKNSSYEGQNQAELLILNIYIHDVYF